MQVHKSRGCRTEIIPATFSLSFPSISLFFSLPCVLRRLRTFPRSSQAYSVYRESGNCISGMSYTGGSTLPTQSGLWARPSQIPDVYFRRSSLPEIIGLTRLVHSIFLGLAAKTLSLERSPRISFSDLFFPGCEMGL